MANKTSISRCTSANVYVNGISTHGRAEKVDLPDIKTTQAEHKAVGMLGKIEYPSGFDKMECKIKWNSYYPEVIKAISNPFKAAKVQVRSSVEVYSAGSRVQEKPLVAYMTVQPKNIPGGAFAPQDNVELETTFGVTYFKLELDGEELIEIDVEANIFKINGEDQMVNYRANLGI